MKRMWIIAKKDIREAIRSRSTYIYIVILIFLTFSYFNGYATVTRRLAATNSSQIVVVQQSQSYLNPIASTLPMVGAIWICTIFATYAVIIEKAKRNIESLMATPVSLNQIWMGKTLAVTLPSVVAALVISAIMYIVMSFFQVIPNTGRFITPSPLAIVTAVIIVPILIYTIVALILYLQLVITNPRIANFVFLAIFFLLFFGVNFLTGAGLNLDFSYIYLGVIVVCAVASYILSHYLTKERVILSSKG